MPLNETEIRRQAFFDDPRLETELPLVNKVFWAALIGHVEQDHTTPPRVVLDLGCHTGEFLWELSRRFALTEIFGVEPLREARALASRRLRGAAKAVCLLDTSEWDRIPSGGVDLITAHEVLYLEPDLQDFMKRIRRVLTTGGTSYVVLGCHAENPLWQLWKKPLIAAGHRVYDHLPIEIMGAASAAGLLPSVQPLRHEGWITYDPLHTAFPYTDVRTMFDHHYRQKLVFRFRIANADTSAP